MPNKTEIIADLDETPVGENGLKKRLTVTETENGKIYSVRAYAPRPSIIQPETYVPARGIDLTEDELKEFTIALQKVLHYMHTWAWAGNKDSEDSFIKVCGLENERDENKELVTLRKAKDAIPDDEKYKEYTDYSDEEDVYRSYDYQNELQCDLDAIIKTIKTKEDNVVKRLSLLYWYDSFGGLALDLRQWHICITEKGYEEMTPILDKGIRLNDIEAEKLCMIVETLFPEIIEGIEEYCDGDYEDKSMIININLSEREREIIKEALNILSDECNSMIEDRKMRGENLGLKAIERINGHIKNAYRKITQGERMLDEEYEVCVLALHLSYDGILAEEEHGFTKNEAKEVADKIENVIDKRLNDIGSYVVYNNERYIDISKGEAEIVQEILQNFYDALYNCEEETEDIIQLKEHISEIVQIDKERRNDLRDLYQNEDEDVGEVFLGDLIDSFEVASEL